MAGHDPSYRLLFSHPRMVEDLLRGFVHEDWLSWLDFTTLERVNGSFVTEGLKDRRNDVIWRVRWEEEGEGGWFYLYLLMEFQSTPDPFMAVRLLVYEGLLLQELIREGGLTASDKLPPILSIVFYNGRRPWKGPLDLQSLFAPVPSSLRRRLPQLEYFLLDENRVSREEKEQPSNVVATLVRMETADGEDFTHFAQELAVLLPREEQAELRRAFTAWMVRVLRETHPGATIPLVEDLEEIPMLAERIREKHRKDLREQRQEGMLLGTRQTVLRLIERRFGPVPASVRARIESLSSQKELNKIADGILTAGSLRELGLE
jgi:predicted transposase/invertase (TIGR01784 family)